MTTQFDKPLADTLLGLRAGTVRAQALAEESIARHRAVGGSLRAYKGRDDEQLLSAARKADTAFARGQDRGALQGIPISVKDLFGVEGYTTYAGSSHALPPQFSQPGPLIAELRRQSAIITGKTHTVEFAFGGLGVNTIWGTPWNPWDRTRHRVPGGSSSGAGVSLACDALLALGTDTAGSVRIPASMTGQVGLKTSYGRWSTGGIVPLSPSLDSVGLLARSVADLRAAIGAFGSGFSGSLVDPAELASVRVGIVDGLFWDDCSTGITESVRQSLRELENHGIRVHTLELPEVHAAYEIFTTGHLAAPELYEFLRSCLPEWLDRLTPPVAARMEAAATLTAHEYLHRKRMLASLAASAADRLAEVDVVLTPTVAVTPPLVSEVEEPQSYRRANILALRNTCVGNLLNLCAISLPVGLDAERMPVGMQLLARHGEDDRLLRIAAAIERRLGTAAQRLGSPALRAD